jgi:hemoglobin
MSGLTQEQLKILVMRFYNQVRQDELLGFIFDDVAQVNWDEHIPKLCKFWNSIMLGTREYHGNAFDKHVKLGQTTLITHLHFDRWLTLFKETAEANLAIKDAQLLVERASLIARRLKQGMGL